MSGLVQKLGLPVSYLFVQVGFMRGGRILAEEEPLKILEKYHMTVSTR